MKTNVELVEELKKTVDNAMKDSDIFEMEITSSLSVSRAHNIIMAFREWIESFEFGKKYLYKDLKNGNLLIYTDRAKEYVNQNVA